MPDTTVAVVYGTRPEIIKLAPVVAALAGRARVVTVATGQHLELGRQAEASLTGPPAVQLGLMRPDQRPEDFCAAALGALAVTLREVKPDIVVAQGDTTTALAAGMAAFYGRVPFAHVEAGLRTYDAAHPWPEEIHRQLIARVARWHFCPTGREAGLLRAEGVDPAGLHVVGNTVIDALERQMAATGVALRSDPTVIVTTHRRENHDQGLQNICQAVATLATGHPGFRFLVPVHPNPNVGACVRAHLAGRANVELSPPLAYDAFIRELAACRLVITDSGGLQEECPHLGKPLLIARTTTERPQAVEAGAALLVGTGVDAITGAADRLMTDTSLYRRMAIRRPLFGDGRAAHRIADILLGSSC